MDTKINGISFNELVNSETFKGLSSENQSKVEANFTNQAWERTKSRKDYALGNDSTREGIQNNFASQFPSGQRLVTHERNKDNSVLENIVQQVGYGAQDTYSALKNVDDIVTGTPDQDFINQITDDSRANRYYSPQLKEANVAIAAATKKTKAAEGFWKKAAAWGEVGLATAVEAVTNPVGTMELGAGSLTYALPGMIMGALARTAGTAVGGPAGFVAGGAARAGQFGGSMATEAGAQLPGLVAEEVQKQGLEVNEENIKAVLSNDDTMDAMISKAGRKGFGTAIIDTFMAYKVGKMQKGTGRFASTRHKAKVLGTETISEPASEVGGLLLADENVEGGDVMGETLGGIGAGPVMAPMNVALHGSKEAGKATAGKIKETRRKKTKEETKAVKDSKSPAQYQYKEKVDEAVKTGEYKNVVDPKATETHDPIMGTEILQKANEKEATTPVEKIKNIDQANEIFDSLDDKITAVTEEAQALPKKEERTKEQQERYMSLLVESRALNATMKKISPIVESLNIPEDADDTNIEDLQKALKSEDNETVKDALLSVYGSKQGANSVNKETLDEILQNPKIDASTKEQVKQVQAYQEKEKAFLKTTDEVHTDIISGSKTTRFKGIKTYHHNIATAVRAGDTDTAKKQLDKFKEFTAAHTEKADVFERVHYATVNELEISDSDQQKMKEYDLKRKITNPKNDGYTLNKNASEMVATIRAEANLLNDAVTAAESLVTPVETVSGTTEENTIDVENYQTDGKTSTSSNKALKQPNTETFKTADTTIPEQDQNAIEQPPVKSKIAREIKNLQDIITEDKEDPTELFNALSPQTKEHIKKALIKNTLSLSDVDTVDAKEAINYYLKTGKVLDTEIYKDTGFKDITKENGFINQKVKEHNFKSESYTVAERKRISESITKERDALARKESDLYETVHERLLKDTFSEQPSVKPISDQTGETKEAPPTDEKTIAKTNKGKWVTIKYPKYTKGFQAQVTGETEAVVTSEVDGVTEEIRHMQFKTKKGKLVTADLSEVTGLSVGTKTNQNTSKTPEENAEPINIWHGSNENADDTTEQQAPVSEDTQIDSSSLDRQELSEMGFRETEIQNMGPEVVSDLLVHKNKSLEQLTADAKKTKPDSPERQTLRKVYQARKRIQSTKESSTNAPKNKTKSKEAPVAKNPTEEGGTETSKEESTEETQEESPKGTQDTEDQTSGNQAPESNEPSIQTKLTTPDENDPNNIIKNDFESVPKEKTSFFQKYTDILSALILDNVISYFPEKRFNKEKTEAFLSSMKKFGSGFRKSYAKIYKKRNLNFRGQDPIQFLADESGKTPTEVIDAIAAASFEWVGTRGRDTIWNNDQAIRDILGLGSDDIILPLTRELMGEIGTSQTAIAENIGKTAYKLLGIKPNKEKVDAYLPSALEQSLGLEAIATMEKMGFLQTTRIYKTGRENVSHYDAETGFEGLKNYQNMREVGGRWMFGKKVGGHLVNGVRLKNDFKVPLAPNDVLKDRRGIYKYYKLPNKIDGETGRLRPLNWVIDNFLTPYKEANQAWSLIFRRKPAERMYFWNKPKNKGKRRKMVKSTGYASQTQSDNLSEHEDRAWRLSQGVATFWQLLGRENIEKLHGKESNEKYHARNKKGIDGTNITIERSIDSILDWFADAEINNPFKKGTFAHQNWFYISQNIWSMGRMGQVGPINPQQDKMHRAIFIMSDWLTDVDLNNREQEDIFLAAVALGFDKETSKEGGITGAIKAAMEVINTDEVQAGIKAIREVTKNLEGKGISIEKFDLMSLETLSNSFITKEQADAITKAAMAGKMKTHSLKALVEYTKYLNAKEKQLGSFTTDITLEIDGIANGIAIGMTQLMSPKAKMPEVLSSLRNSGYSFGKGDDISKHLKKKTTHDSYLKAGFAWAQHLLKNQKSLLNKLREEEAGTADYDKKINEYKAFKALEHFIGSFFEEGGLAKQLRKLSKDPTMKTVYGMMEAALLREVGELFITNIYEEIETIVTNDDIEGLQNFSRRLNDIAPGFKPFYNKAIVNNGVINKEKVLNTYLNPQMERVIRNRAAAIYGEALSTAIKEVYGPLQEAYQPLNDALNLATAQYNVIRDAEIAKLEAESKKRGKGPTIAEIEAINKKLGDMVPYIKTPFGNKLPLAVEEKQKQPKQEKQIYQQYAKGTLLPKYAIPAIRGRLAAPGARGTILAIHNFDSSIPTTLMATEHFLNNHDGFTKGIGGIQKFTELTNDTYAQGMENHDIAANIYAAVKDIDAQFSERYKGLMTGINAGKALKKEMKDNTKLGRHYRTVEIEDPGRNGSKDHLHARLVANTLLNNAEAMADVVTRNKKTLMDAHIKMEQYSLPGGAKVTDKRAKPIKHKDVKYPTGKIDTDAKDKVNAGMDQIAKDLQAIQEIKDALVEEAGYDVFGSSQNEMSIDPDDYNIRMEINQDNVVNTYDRIKNDSSVKDDPEHDQHLKNVLNTIVYNVMEPLDLHTKVNPDAETQGKYDAKTGRVFISNQKTIIGPVSGALQQGIRMSTGEVFTHEMLHPILRTGLSKLSPLRNRVEKLYQIARADLNKNGEGYRVFLNNSNMDVNDTANKYEVQAAQDRFDYIFNNREVNTVSGSDSATGLKRSHSTLNYLDEFMVLGLTNKNFMKYLAGVKLSETTYVKNGWKSLFGSNIQEMLGNVFQQVMNWFYRSFTKRGSGTMDAELMALATQLTKRDSEYKTAIFKGIKKAGTQYTKAKEKAEKFIKSRMVKWPILKSINGLKYVVETAKSGDNPFSQRLREMEYSYRQMDEGIIKSIATEMAGRTNKMDWAYHLLNHRKLVLDAMKVDEIEQHITMANSLFEGKLEEHQREGITKGVLKADLVSLLDSLGINRISKILKSFKANQKEIDSVLTELRNDKELAPYFDYYNNASEAMGHFMVHKRARDGEEVFQNAAVIASLRNMKMFKNKPTGEAYDRAESIVERLGSLYAVQHTANSHKKAVADLLGKQPESIEGVMRMHAALKDRAAEAIFTNNKFGMIKGYTKSITNPQKSVAFGTEDEKTKMADAGYVMKPGMIERDSLDPTKDIPIYMYTAKAYKINDMVTGAFSFTNNKAMGSDMVKIGTQLGNSIAKSKLNNLKVIKDKAKLRERMAKPGYTVSGQAGNNLIPRTDSHGYVVGYRYMMGDASKEAYLEQKTDFADILGSMAGQIVDKAKTPEINKQVVDHLHTEYKDDYKTNPKAFVKVGPDADDPKMRELYYMFPHKARKDIRNRWGSDNMYVAKEKVTILFGYRMYSMTDAFTKDPAERAKLEKVLVAVAKTFFKDNKAMQRVGTLEDFMKGATKIAKSNIIVKSLGVTLGNLGSNLVYLKSHGVPMADILRLSYQAIVMGNKYQADHKKLQQARLKKSMLLKGKHTRAAVKELDTYILQLEDAITRNPTTVTIEAGLMPSLIDDVETVTGGQAFKTSAIKKIEAAGNKLPSFVRNTGKVLLLTEDTKAFKTLNNAVKMTDFIGRHVLYNHYTKKGIKNHREAVNDSIEEFINFNVPTHRMVEYSNAIGFLWFTKYGTRILKVIKDSAINRPVDTLLSLLLANYLGMDNIFESIPGVTKDLFANIDNPLASFIESLDEPITVQGLEAVF